MGEVERNYPDSSATLLNKHTSSRLGILTFVMNLVLLIITKNTSNGL